MIIAILGRQPSIGIAELESLFGANILQPIGDECALLDIEPRNFLFKRLGGTMKVAKIADTINTTNWNEIENYLTHKLTENISQMSPGKVRIGFSAYGFNVSSQQLQSAGLRIKKSIKNNPQTGSRSVRIVPNNAPQLNSAQIIYNRLTESNGLEIVVARNGKNTIIGTTFAVQDIDAYASRDQARPKRDARVGMLPPKLAQIIINLAVGQFGSNEQIGTIKELAVQSSSFITHQDKVVLDPFCGTGVILQEALLMGYGAYGSDIDPKMIEYSTQNLSWLQTKHKVDNKKWKLETSDALIHKWDSFDTVASETYLGRPFSAEPKQEILRQVIQGADTIHKKFLKNLASQTKPGLRMCLAVPAWRTNNSFRHLKTLDSLEELGYTRKSFVHAHSESLIYHRPDQIVARELVVLIRQ